MAKLTQEETQKIKDSVIASCISKGIKPVIISGGMPMPNPLYSSCVQLGYDDAVKHAEQGKLGLWFGKVNSFVQSQGGVTGLLQSVSSIANQYREQTANLQQPGMSNTQFPPGYDQAGMGTSEKDDNMGLWLVLIILLIILIIAAVIYFKKNNKTGATA
jgi:hypothetical protein